MNLRVPARLLAALTSSLTVALGIVAMPTAHATTFGVASSSPADGSYVKQSAVTAQSPISICFTATLNPLTSSISSVSGASHGSVTGVPAVGNCAGGTSNELTFTPATLPLVDDAYTVVYSANDTTPVTPNTASGSIHFTVDDSQPAPPTISNSSTNPIDAPNASAITVTGTAEPTTAASGGFGADTITMSLTVHSPSGGTDVTKTTTTDGSGNYTFSNVDVSGLADDAAVTYSVTATDAAGNTSGAATKSVLKDTVAPALTTSTPADGSSHKSLSSVTLTFDQPLDPAHSSGHLVNGASTDLTSSSALDGTFQTLTVNATGSLSEAGNPYSVNYSVQDVNGNVSTGSIHFTIDNTAPAAPVISTVSDPVNIGDEANVVVTGTAEPGSTIAVALSDGHNSATGSVVATGGNYDVSSIDATGLLDGTSNITVSVTSTDAAGNTSTAATRTISKDTVAPAQPGAVTVSPSSINATTQTGVVVSGSVASDVTSVRISVDDTDAGTAPVVATVTPATGAYTSSLDLSTLHDGTLTASVVAFDSAGNQSPAQTATATKDAGVPSAPSVTISPKPIINAAHAASVTVSGTAEPAASVHLSVDDDSNAATAPLTQTVAADGTTGAYTTTFNVTTLSDGTLTATATAEDAAHNVSAPASDTATLDTHAPSAPAVTVPSYANATNASAYDVMGTAEPGSTVTVTFSDADAGTADIVATTTADASTGAWSLTQDVTSQTDGALHVSATATDAGQNVSSATVKDATKDTAPPAPPTVSAHTSPINTGNVTAVSISGNAGAAEANSTVDVSIDDANNAATAPVTGLATAAGDGSYSITGLDVTSLHDGTLTFTVHDTDVAGNRSTTSTQVTSPKDTTVFALLSRTPASERTKTPSAVVANFSEPVNPAVTSITVKDKTLSVAGGTTTLSNDNMTVTFTPNSPFSEVGSPYTFEIKGDDLAGDPAVDDTFNFTVDNTPPSAPAVTTPPTYANIGNAAVYPVSGTAEAGSTVTLTFSDSDSGTADVVVTTPANESDGTWSTAADLRPLVDGAIAIAVTATDAATNVSPASNASATKDTVAPTTPSVTLTNPINHANETAAGVSGAADPGTDINVVIGDGTTFLTPSTTADGNGQWSITGIDVSSLADGPVSSTVTATDAAGNVSPRSDPSSATKDTLAPGQPTVSLPAAINAANASSATVSGTAEPGSSVALDLTDGTTHVTPPATTTDSGGHWSISGLDLHSLADGPVTATATATDAVGNVSPVSPTVNTSKDTAVPAKPTVASVTSPVNAANAWSITVSGTAEPNSSVAVDVTDGTNHVAPTATTADGAGNWAMSGVDVRTLADGPLAATATATDAAGNTSPASDTKAATKDTAAPAKPTLSLPMVNAANASSITVSGTAEPNSSLALDVTDGSTHVTPPATTTDGAGHWSISGLDVHSLADGTVSATAIATDAAGNASPASNAATATKDTVAPAKPTLSLPTVNAANASSITVSGTAEPNSSVAVDVTDGTHHVAPAATTADGAGNWTVSGVDVRSLADGTITATAIATDAAGNASAPSDQQQASKATVLPGAPASVVTRAGDGAVVVSWTAATNSGTPIDHYVVTPSQGAPVTVTGSTLTATVTGLTNGTTYTFTVAAQNAAGSGPASAGATATPKFVTRLSIRTSASKVVYGHSVTLSGALTRSNGTGISGAHVGIYRRYDGGSTVHIATVTTGTGGAWHYTFNPVHNFTGAAFYSGDAADLAKASSNVRTLVASLIRLSSPLNGSTSSTSKALAVTGSVSPNKAGQTVKLYYVDSAGHVHLLASTKLSSKSQYRFSVNLKRGTWKLRVLIASVTGNYAGSSQTIKVKRT